MKLKRKITLTKKNEMKWKSNKFGYFGKNNKSMCMASSLQRADKKSEKK